MKIKKEFLKEIGEKNWKKIQEEGILAEDELILGVVKGRADAEVLGERTIRDCRLIITNTRLLVFMPKRLGRYESMDFPYGQITSIHKHKGVRKAALALTVANKDQKIGTIDKKKIDGIYKLIQEQIKKAQ